MGTYLCTNCNENRYSPVCPICFETATGVQIPSFVVHVEFVVEFEGNLFSVVAVNKNSVSIRPIESEGRSTPISINKVLYQYSVHGKLEDNKIVFKRMDDMYMRKDNWQLRYNESFPSSSAYEKGEKLANDLLKFVFSGAFDDMFNAADVIDMTRKYEAADKKYLEALEAATQQLNEREAYKARILESKKIVPLGE